MERKICLKCNYACGEAVDTCPEDELYEGFDRMAVLEMDGGVYGF